VSGASTDGCSARSVGTGAPTSRRSPTPSTCPCPTVRERIRALEADGTVRGYSARLDHDELGHVTAILRLRVDRAAVAAVVERLESLPRVVAL